MKYHLITDTHFSHARILEIRPANYEEQIIRSLQEIPTEDVLIHLGDICIGNDIEVHEKIISPLRCRKILVKGNHDNKSHTWYMNHGWDFACDKIEMKYGGENLVFTHIPVHPHEFDGLNIHGHYHDLTHRDFPEWYTDDHKLVSLERQGYHTHSLLKFIQ